MLGLGDGPVGLYDGARLPAKGKSRIRRLRADSWPLLRFQYM